MKDMNRIKEQDRAFCRTKVIGYVIKAHETHEVKIEIFSNP